MIEIFNRRELEHLKKFLRGSQDYSIDIDGILIPKRYINTDIGLLRSKLIHNMSEKERSFIYNLNSAISRYGQSGCYYISQFPILLSDRDLWYKCCTNNRCFGISDSNGIQYQNRIIIYVDAYFANLNIVIEVDYISTHINVWNMIVLEICT